MAINLSAIVQDDKKSDAFFAWVFQRVKEPMTELCTACGGTVRQCETELLDETTGELLGKLIYTLGVQAGNGGASEEPVILDVDLVLKNRETIHAELLQEFGRFEGWNKNYIAQAGSEEQRFVAEAANRFVPGSAIEGKTLTVSLSAFPWTFDIFATMKALNGALGFGYEEESDENPHVFGGFSNHFTMPCVESENSHYTAVVGTIRGFRDVCLKAGDADLRFTVVDLETGLGMLPAAVSSDCFDLSDLREGSHVIMNASISAELLDSQEA